MKALVIRPHWVLEEGTVWNVKDSDVSINMVLVEVIAGPRVMWLDFLRSNFIVFPNDCKLLKLLEKTC